MPHSTWPSGELLDRREGLGVNVNGMLNTHDLVSLACPYVLRALCVIVGLFTVQILWEIRLMRHIFTLSMLRFLHEDPWERLEALRAKVPNVPFQVRPGHCRI